MLKSLVITFAFVAFNFSGVFAAEKLKFATAVKIYPLYYLPLFAAEERNLWKQEGLEVEWVPFSGAEVMFRSVAAKTLEIGMTPAITGIQSTVMGVPITMISDLVPGVGGWAVWLPKNSPIKDPKDLKGARIGVAGLGASSHAFGLAIAKALGLEREVRFVGVGGVAPMAAALKAGVVAAVVTGPAAMLELKARGEAYELLFLAPYLAKEWMDHGLFARKDFLRANLDLTKKVIKTILQAAAFARENPAWSLEKMKAFSGYSEPTARLWFNEVTRLTKDGRVDKRAIGNILEFLLNYGIVPRERALPVEELFTPGLTG